MGELVLEVLAGGDAAKEVCVRPPEESVAEGVGVGVLTAADVDKELCVMLSDEGAAEGVGVGVTATWLAGGPDGDGPGQRTIRPQKQNRIAAMR